MTSLPAWRVLRACDGVANEVFFGTPGRGNYQAQAEDKAARRTYCAHCPVAAQCRAEAFELEPPGDYRYGVRGNMTAKERERYWRAYRAAATEDHVAAQHTRVYVAGETPVRPGSREV